MGLIDSASTVLIPLSILDSGIDCSGISTFWIVDCPGDSFSVPILEAATSRALEKWRVFAGRLRRQPADKTRWNLLVPIGPIPVDYPLFTSVTETILKNLAYPHLGSNDAQIISQIPDSYYRDKDNPCTNAEYAKTNSPMLALKITKFLDSVVIGISFPHGIVDGTSISAFFAVIGSELRGEEDFKAPALQESNLVQEQLERILETGKVEIDPSAVQYEEAGKFAEKLTWFSGLKFILRMKWEIFWHGAQERTLFLGKEVIRDLIATSKAEVKALGDGSFISTNDILITWFIQTILKEQPKIADEILVVTAISVKSVLTPASNPNLLHQYAHVTTMLATYPTLSTQQFIENSIGTTSLLFRKSILASLCTNYVIDNFNHFEACKPMIPKTRYDQLRFGFANQSFKGFKDFPFDRCVLKSGEEDRKYDGRTICQFNSAFPGKSDHCLSITEQDGVDGNTGGSFAIHGVLRAKGWKALEQEIERMKKLV